MSSTDMLKVDEVAAALEMKPERVRVWLREGRIVGSMLGGDRSGWRVPRAEVERIQRQTELGGRVTERVHPIRAITVYTANPMQVELIDCGTCGTILRRGDACAHLRFSTRTLAGEPQVSVELHPNVDAKAPRRVGAQRGA